MSRSKQNYFPEGSPKKGIAVLLDDEKMMAELFNGFYGSPSEAEKTQLAHKAKEELEKKGYTVSGYAATGKGARGGKAQDGS